jgi:hypothetical protein
MEHLAASQEKTWAPILQEYPAKGQFTAGSDVLHKPWAGDETSGSDGANSLICYSSEHQSTERACWQG